MPDFKIGFRRPGWLTSMRPWALDEPSTRGTVGEERMRLIRDELAESVRRLASDLAVPSAV